MQPSAQKPLAFLEARILGVLVEKERTTPDIYPLTLNSLASGCNQKSARDPVINVKDSEVQAALDELRSRVLVLETYGASGRVLRYAQNFGRVYALFLRVSPCSPFSRCVARRRPANFAPTPSDCTDLMIRRPLKPTSTKWHRARVTRW